MNQEVKDKWIKALRSGEYKQGMLQLRHNDKYCCLGVLCDIHAKDNGGTWGPNDSYLGSQNFLPKEVHMWSRLSREEESPLVRMNDAGKSFLEIADIIEKSC